MGGLVAHPRVDDDPGSVREEAVRRRRATRAIEELGDRIGRIVVAGDQELLAGALVDEPVDLVVDRHDTSATTGNRSK